MSVNNHAYVIIGGSTKCATTSLFAYLADHPEISGSIIKESRFFWKGDYQLKKETVNIDDGLNAYDNLFLDKSKAKYRLEATPDYLYGNNTAQLIKNSLIDVRFIFIVRDPVDRIKSWYKFSKQLNLIPAKHSIDEYIRNQIKQVSKSTPQHLRAIEQGRYGYYLNNYLVEFGKDKIKVIRYEELTTSPKETLIEISRFLNIDPAFYNNYSFQILNQSVNVKNAKSFNTYRNLRRSMRRMFKKILPDPLKNSFRNVFKKVDRIYMKTNTTDFEEINISFENNNMLNEYYSEDRAAVERIVSF